MRVLFIGNSYTYFNRLPDLVAALSASRPDGPAIKTESVTEGGVSLEWHWGNSPTLAAIRRGGWDRVVLQEQSTRPVRERNMTIRYGRMLAGEIAAVGATPALYCTWAREHIPEMTEPLVLAYSALAADIGADVAPVGPAFSLARKDLPQFSLYNPDHSHPSLLGAYLAACVFYATLTGVCPVGLATTLVAGDEMLADLNKETAMRLQTTAWQAYRAFVEA